MTQPIRLIVDPPLGGAVNMARDEALLASMTPGDAPVLRFYQWRPAAVSLGYFQPIAAWQPHAESLAGCDLVRRLTGGGAILHHAELTYSLTVPANFGPIRSRPTELYELAGQAIRRGLGELGVSADFFAGQTQGNSQRGPFFCFARRHRYDLVVGPDKIVGSAQRRRAGTILQHGSIILRQVGPQPCTGINDHAPAAVDVRQLVSLLSRAFASVLRLATDPSGLTAAESNAAARLQAKYASDAWTRQR